MADEDRLVAERTRLAAVHADLTMRIEELQSSKEAVRARLLELGAGDAGPLRVVVTPVRRLDAAAFVKKYDPAIFPGYYEHKPVAAMAKALHDDSVYIDGSPQVRVIAADN